MVGTIVFGFYGPTLDAGKNDRRWDRWRPTVSLCQQEDLLVDRFELLHQRAHRAGAERVAEDIGMVAPETEVVLHEVRLADPWDFEEVFAAFHDLARRYPFAPETERYLVHITTGTHVMQICWFLLTESRHFPAALVQVRPPQPRDRGGQDPGGHQVIDLDRSRYDRLARRFADERAEGLATLKQGIDTRNAAFNRLVASLEQVALRSREPILLTGPTGAGKTHLARQIDTLLRSRRQLEGPLVEVNCATLRGDGAMSALFGHVRGAYTGAVADREGLLARADGGLLFLDEIGELGVDEQAMLLRAVEEKRFLPVGTDREASSDFRLVAGTNRDLRRAVTEGRFREDLLARIDLWTFELPGLADRPEDIAPNLDHELARAPGRLGVHITMNGDARRRFLSFATSAEATWNANFRDFSAAVSRMATLAPGGRIDVPTVEEEITRLQRAWGQISADGLADGLDALLGTDAARALDRFDRVQLAEVVRVCRRSDSLSAAGRVLFAASRRRRRSVNDADRLRKYLHRHGLTFERVSASPSNGPKAEKDGNRPPLPA
ncbi:MAG: RNA repair transcriptional activator RtcR [Myxococcota bacterium]